MAKAEARLVTVTIYAQVGESPVMNKVGSLVRLATPVPLREGAHPDATEAVEVNMNQVLRDMAFHVTHSADGGPVLETSTPELHCYRCGRPFGDGDLYIPVRKMTHKQGALHGDRTDPPINIHADCPDIREGAK